MFGAVQDEVVADAPVDGRHASDVGPSAGLRDAVRCDRALADELPEVAAALLLGTRDEEGMGGEAVGGNSSW
jgi:hypothetical protein